MNKMNKKYPVAEFINRYREIPLFCQECGIELDEGEDYMCEPCTEHQRRQEYNGE